MTLRPLISAGLLLGVGMGGFIDGIIFHQVLQLHSMLSAVRPRDSLVGLEINMFWDGLFHAFTWITTAVGLWLLWRAARRPEVPWLGRALVGAMVAGWGLFNFVEGIVDHFLLQVHHVVESAGLSVWDWLFVGSGVLMMVVGWAMVATTRPRDTSDRWVEAHRTP